MAGRKPIQRLQARVENLEAAIRLDPSGGPSYHRLRATKVLATGLPFVGTAEGTDFEGCVRAILEQLDKAEGRRRRVPPRNT